MESMTGLEKERFLNVSKRYLSLLGEDLKLLDPVLKHEEYHVSTATGLLKELVISSVVKIKDKDITAAKELGHVADQLTHKDLKDRATFEFLLNELDTFSQKYALIF